MQITLINGYYIEVEERNYILKQKYEGKSKDGDPKEAERTFGYYGKLGPAIEEFLKQNQSDCGADMAMEMEEYAQFVSRANKEAVEAITAALSTRF